MRLNALRENSCLKIYNCGQKSNYLKTSYNLAGFQFIQESEGKQINLSEEIILEKLKNNEDYSQEIFRKFINYEMCHHCRLLFPI